MYSEKIFRKEAINHHVKNETFEFTENEENRVTYTYIIILWIISSILTSTILFLHYSFF